MIAMLGRKAVLLLLLVICALPLALAQGGPPLITDDPGTPGNGHWEINLGITIEQLMHETNFELPLLDVNYGAGDNTQLKVELPYAVQHSGGFARGGLGNTKIGIKWRWLDEDKHGFALSTYPQLTFNNPTASVRRGLADDGWQIFLPVEISRSFGPVELNGEAGYNIQQRQANEIWMGMAAGIQACKRVELLGELHSISSQRLDENESVFDLGTRVKLNSFNTLLFSAGRSLPGSTGGEPGFIAYVGLQFAF
jgi:hypothetical protein